MRKAGLLLVVFHSGLAVMATAQPSPNGPQFQVNTYTPRNQEAPAVAVGPDGGFVIAWDFGYGWPTYDGDVRFQRYDAAGIPLGGEQRIVDGTGAGNQPAVAIDGSGAFVIVWLGTESVTNGTPVVRARRFDSGGVPLGDDFPVSTHSASVPFNPLPAVAASPAGDFVVVWQATGSPEGDTDAGSVQARLFDAGGNPVSAQFQVNTYTTGEQKSPAVAMNTTGGFVVTWRNLGVPNDTYGTIDARRFAADGTPLGGEFRVNSYTPDLAPGEPRIAVGPEGDFVVVWSSYDWQEPADESHGVQARRFAADGTPLGDDFQVNTYTTFQQRTPDVAMDARGEFVVVWQSDGTPGPGSDPTGFDVKAQRFDAAGAPVGAEFQVNTYTTLDQSSAAVALDASGNFVVVWASNGSGGSDQDWMSVQGQRFDQLFRDGFESGDAGRWSAALP